MSELERIEIKTIRCERRLKIIYKILLREGRGKITHKGDINFWDDIEDDWEKIK